MKSNEVRLNIDDVVAERGYAESKRRFKLTEKREFGLRLPT